MLARPIPAILLGIVAASSGSESTPQTQRLDESLSLQDLLSTGSSLGTLTLTEESRRPVSATVITAEDIRLTPARNLLDLLEALVPGFEWYSHSEQPRLGLRGLVVDRNYKMLLLVDGHLMNQRTHSGIVTEIENWDLSDIERIEVVRGPGSVTYGPGAVAGVIRITTRRAEDLDGLEVSSRAAWPYRSAGGAVQWGHLGPLWDLHVYGSGNWTRGAASPTEFVEYGSTNLSNYTLGQVGSDAHVHPSRALESQAILADYDQGLAWAPQTRLHLDLSGPAGFSAWARYTQGGNTTGSGFSQVVLPDGEELNARTYASRQAVGALRREIRPWSGAWLETRLEAGSQDYERYSGTLVDSISFTDPVNTTHNFAETDLTVATLLRQALGSRWQLAGGAEYVYTHVGPGWFDDPRALRLGDGKNIVNGPDSWIVWHGDGAAPSGMLSPSEAIYVGDDGFSAGQISFLGEANLGLSEHLQLLLSGRLDKNELSPWLVSPRTALIVPLGPRRALRAIWQRSMRMNTLEQMVVEDRQGRRSRPEVLSGWEAIYSDAPTRTLSLEASAWLNDVETIGWNTTLRQTVLQGTMRVWGGELSANWKSGRWDVRASHAFTALLDWNLADALASSGISYSDLNDYQVVMTTPVNGTTRRDTVRLSEIPGGALNNWANQASKAVVRVRLSRRWSLQLGARALWDFQGYKDQLAVLRNVSAATEDDTLFERHVKPTIDSLVDLVEAQDPFGLDARLDLSLQWRPSPRLRLELWAQNLVACGARRYGYITGLVAATPRVSWTEEPRMFGLRATHVF